MRRFAVAALALGLPLLSVATAHADTTTVTITGVAWKDLNGDGIRQPDEPLLPGINIGDTTTDATGHYTLHDVALDAPSVQASPRAIDGGRIDGQVTAKLIDTDSDVNPANNRVPGPSPPRLTGHEHQRHRQKRRCRRHRLF